MTEQNYEKLSGNGATGGPIALATHPTLTEVHVVPAGETHFIELWGTNGDNTTPREILGNWGEGADLFDYTVPAETTQLIARGVLVGPTSIDLGKVSGSQVRVFGYMRRFRYA